MLIHALSRLVLLCKHHPAGACRTIGASKPVSQLRSRLPRQCFIWVGTANSLPQADSCWASRTCMSMGVRTICSRFCAVWETCYGLGLRATCRTIQPRYEASLQIKGIVSALNSSTVCLTQQNQRQNHWPKSCKRTFVVLVIGVRGGKESTHL